MDSAKSSGHTASLARKYDAIAVKVHIRTDAQDTFAPGANKSKAIRIKTDAMGEILAIQPRETAAGPNTNVKTIPPTPDIARDALRVDDCSGADGCYWGWPCENAII